MAPIYQATQDYYENDGSYGNYQFTSLDAIISQFMISYVGEDKLISKVRRLDVQFHAMRSLQELSFDTLKSIKAQEITVPATLQMILPQDYVNYTKISWIDSSGIKHLLYPASKTSNPSSSGELHQSNPFQNSDGDFLFQAVGDLQLSSNSVTLDGEYKNILVGMLVSGAYIPSGTYVKSTDNSSGTTVITLEDFAGVEVNPGYMDGSVFVEIANTATTLTFSQNNDGSLTTLKKSYNVVDGLAWNLSDYKITALSASDITNVKIGMLVYHDDFSTNTFVRNVSGTTIVVSQLPDPSSSVVTSGEITFVDPEEADTDTWAAYKSSNLSKSNSDDYEDDTYWPMNGNRYGLDPQYAQANGSFYIDEISGKIHFSSNILGKTVILDYISDGLGTAEEMQVHKFAEEAMYKSIAYAILSTKASTQEYIVRRYKKERFAEVRKAKLRLSNVKLEELTQILRGKSKQIKH